MDDTDIKPTWSLRENQKFWAFILLVIAICVLAMCMDPRSGQR